MCVALANFAQAGDKPAVWAKPDVFTLKLSFSNVHVIRAASPVLIDAGSPSDWQTLVDKLADYEMKPCDIRWVVLTHAHPDHGGLAAKFQEGCGAKVVMHRRDIPMAAAGGVDPALKYTRWISRLIWKLVDYQYLPFKPDLAIDVAPFQSFDLAAIGLEGHAISVPGHTSGSLAIALSDGRTFLGDMMAGGYLGGLVHAGQASEHYFHGDSAQNYRSLRGLLEAEALSHTFYLGHGGPLQRSDVLRALTALESRPHNDVLIRTVP